MRKMIALGLVMAMALSFAAGCKKKETAPTAPAATQEATQAPISSAKAPAAEKK